MDCTTKEEQTIIFRTMGHFKIETIYKCIIRYVKESYSLR
jgi:hypothetical protein